VVTPQPPKLATGRFWAKNNTEFKELNKAWPTAAEVSETKGIKRSRPCDPIDRSEADMLGLIMKEHLVKAVKRLSADVIGKAYIFRWFETFGRHDPDKHTVKELMALLEEARGITFNEEVKQRVLGMQYGKNMQDWKNLFFVSGPGASNDNEWQQRASAALNDLREISRMVESTKTDDGDVSVSPTDSVYGDGKDLTKFTNGLQEDLEKLDQE